MVGHGWMVIFQMMVVSNCDKTTILIIYSANDWGCWEPMVALARKNLSKWRIFCASFDLWVHDTTFFVRRAWRRVSSRDASLDLWYVWMFQRKQVSRVGCKLALASQWTIHQLSPGKIGVDEKHLSLSWKVSGQEGSAWKAKNLFGKDKMTTTGQVSLLPASLCIFVLHMVKGSRLRYCTSMQEAPRIWTLSCFDTFRRLERQHWNKGSEVWNFENLPELVAVWFFAVLGLVNILGLTAKSY